MIRAACVQWDVQFADPETNSRRAVNFLHSANGSLDFAIFPEAFLTGYCVSSPNEAKQIAIPTCHPSLIQLEQAALETNIVTIVGFAELSGESLYNSVALFEAGQPARYYRKAHLPYLGYDRFATPGDQLQIFDTKIGKLGILICFDFRFPEACRTLALQGCDILCIPTNWPVGAEVTAEHISRARAAENSVFVMTCNRVGTENGITFIGNSKILGIRGEVLAESGNDEAIPTAEFDPHLARDKRRVVIPGIYETDNFATRQPHLYSEISR